MKLAVWQSPIQIVIVPSACRFGPHPKIYIYACGGLQWTQTLVFMLTTRES